METPASVCSAIREADSKRQWVDITQNMRDACSSLQLGELVHGESFGLFEAMSAIEMMDNKMDSGISVQEVRQVRNLAESAEAGTVPIRDVPLDLVIAVVDDTYACMISWLESHGLAQTVCTNLYLLDVHLVEDRIVRAFSVAVLKLVGHIRERIQRAQAFEDEEDFNPLTFGFSFCDDVTEQRALGMLREAEDDLNRLLRREPNDEVAKQRSAVLARLVFTRSFLSTLMAFTREKCSGLDDAQRHIVAMKEQLVVMRETLNLGRAAEMPEKPSPFEYPVVAGFEPRINQRVWAPTFPRLPAIPSRADSMAYLELFIERLFKVQRVGQLRGLHELIHYQLEFSKDSPCVLSRSELHLVSLPQNRRLMGVEPLNEAIKEQIRQFILPPVLPPRSLLHDDVCEVLEAFFINATKPISLMLNASLQNRARQRGRWAHLLEDWCRLQDDADKLDGQVHMGLTKLDPERPYIGCFGTWVLYHTLWCQIRYLLAGFELELYAPFEFHFVYWYLHECLYQWLYQMLSRADKHIVEQEAILDSKNRKKKRSTKRKFRPHQREALHVQAQQGLAGAFYKFITGLTLAGKIVPPSYKHGCSEEVRFVHRTAPFQAVVTPPPVQYQSFLDMTVNRRKTVGHDNATEMYSQAMRAFEHTWKLLDEITPSTAEIQGQISRQRFLMLHEVKNEDGIRNFFQEIYECYIKLAMNPFHELNAPIRSEVFAKKAQFFGRKFLTG